MKSKSFKAALHIALTIVVTAAIATTVAAKEHPGTSTFHGKNGRIVFIQFSAVYTMNPDGSDVQKLNTGSAACCASWSPDGKQVVFSNRAAGGFQISLVNADGSNQHSLLTEAGYVDEDASFSPDGSQIVFSRCQVNCAIYRIQADGTGLTPITTLNSNLDAYERYPAYSPDGKTIAFAGILENDGVICATYSVNADGSGHIQQLTVGERKAFLPDWSPDGTKIAYSTNNSNWLETLLDEEIWVSNAEGREFTQLTDNNLHWDGYNTGSHDFAPSWSPAQDMIVFERDSPDLKTTAIYVMNSDGTGQMQIESGGTHPRWGVAQP